jgi:hypothetical protein
VGGALDQMVPLSAGGKERNVRGGWRPREGQGRSLQQDMHGGRFRGDIDADEFHHQQVYGAIM